MFGKTVTFQLPYKQAIEEWQTENEQQLYNIQKTNTLTMTHRDAGSRLRTDLVPDLDHEEDNTIPEICGVYAQIDRPSYQCALGSWVLGVDGNKNFGLFVGLNKRFSFVQVPDGVSNVYPNGIISNVHFLEWRNTINTLDWYQKRKTTVEDNLEVLGITYNLETPKYLIHWNSTRFADPFKVNRYFIVENQINPMVAKKFWYCDDFTYITYCKAPERLFQGVFYVNSEVKHSLTFHYMNMLDQTDTRPDIQISFQGLTRKNPNSLILKNQYGIEDILNPNKNYQYNLYIANWVTPNAFFPGD